MRKNKNDYEMGLTINGKYINGIKEYILICRTNKTFTIKNGGRKRENKHPGELLKMLLSLQMV